MDGNGKLDFIFTNDVVEFVEQGYLIRKSIDIFVWELNYTIGNYEWPMFRHDPEHTGCFDCIQKEEISVIPNSAPTYSLVNITGSGFGNQQGNIIFQRNKNAVVYGWTDNKITVRVPAQLIEGNITIKKKDGNTIIGPVFYPYKPVINKLTCEPSRSSLTLKGSKFGTAKGKVFYGNDTVRSIFSWNETEIVISRPYPKDKTPQNITVTNTYGYSSVGIVYDPVKTCPITSTGQITAEPADFNRIMHDLFFGTV
ncbi:MAG: hypothetical protein HY832_01995 [Candidatus Aenigmarchaeota archaeon]|nr:hypothetical protein [Candidatus Aenigmarchaeota archaeon]